MIQLQMLNYIIKNKKTNLLDQYDIQFYDSYKNEYKFISKHYKTYKTVPDIETVLEEFPDFNVLDVTESEKYLTEKLYEDYTYNKSSKILNEGVKLYEQDSRTAVNWILTKLSEIKPPSTDIGVDIISQAIQRYDEHIDKISEENKENWIFSTGFKELDEIIDGLQRGEELVVIYARTNNGKSWVAEKLAISVWEQGEGHNVGFFSPEMSASSVGYRFDTLYKNFDNKGVMGVNTSFNSTAYKKYIDKLSKKDKHFYVTTPNDFIDKKVTVSVLRNWIDAKNLELLVIDGITYLTDERSNKKENATTQLTNISEDLMSLSIEKKIPIIVVVQANRVAARDSSGEINDDTPELDTIRNSDGISHNASKALAVRQKKDNLTITISKNRNGKVGNKLIYNWNINEGKFTYLHNPNSGLENSDKIAEDTRNQFKDSEELF